eukprot:878899-Prorocentrum_minimum.AAC.2
MGNLGKRDVQQRQGRHRGKIAIHRATKAITRERDNGVAPNSSRDNPAETKFLPTEINHREKRRPFKKSRQTSTSPLWGWLFNRARGVRAHYEGECVTGRIPFGAVPSELSRLPFFTVKLFYFHRSCASCELIKEPFKRTPARALAKR